MPNQLPLIDEPPAEYDAERERRRAEYRERLRATLQDPAFRAIEGFPLASDDAILALSDPPHYTACPNPFLPEILAEWTTEAEAPDVDRPEVVGQTGRPYHREPFAADVSEGKNDPIYNAHSYHTKVPHKAIMRYILHYTEPGDVVLDGFCGTGMTGVAAQLCGDRDAVQELGYFVDDDGNIFDRRPATDDHTPSLNALPSAFSRLGARKAVLVDLSPAATFIAYNYNTPVDAAAFDREANRILREVEAECGWMYETWHVPPASDKGEELKGGAMQGIKGRINYTVWSEVFLCPECGGELVFLDEALDPETQRVRESFPCPHCGAEMSKRTLDKCRITVYDPVLRRTVETLKRQPALIDYQVGRNRYSKRPDVADLKLLEKVEALPVPVGFPISELPYMHMTHERMRIANYGVTHLHHFFLPRARHVLHALWNKAQAVSDSRLRAMLLFSVEQAIWGMSLLNRYGPTHYSQVNRYLSGVYYISSLISEVSPWYILEGKTERLRKAFSRLHHVAKSVVVSTQSAAASTLPDESVDYIFTDPPFGENIYYADLNYLVESWHGVTTDSAPEAIVDQAKRKTLDDYQSLMRAAFRTYHQALKPGRWMTVEFHNSHNAVWNAIQEALQSVGFVIADVRTLDKQSGSYRQVTAASAAKQDLVISAYKPNDNLEVRFRRVAGTGQGVWDFVDYHLGRLPVPALLEGRLEGVAERQNYLLFDRMVAFHVQRGYPIPLDAAEFYAGLNERYSVRDKMYFLPQQAAEYDRRFLQAQEVGQLPLIVTDRGSARQWVRLRLEEGPRTEGELQPLFMREAQRAWGANEEPVELRDILHEDFIQDAEGRWCVPDPNQEQHLAQLRERRLQHVFESYLKEKGRLRVFRKEALLAGFRHAWREQRYADILAVAARLPARVLQEDPQLLMYTDNARIKAEG